MSDNKNFLESLARDIKSKKENKPLAEEVKNTEEVKKQVKESPKKQDGVKPESFETETFTRIEKKKFTLSPLKLGAGVAVLLSIAVISYFMFFAPKIEMLDFVGKNFSEFTSWAAQYNIDKNGVAINREYNFEYDKDVIISQSISAGKKIKENTKLTLVVSDGADPDELVNFPDIKNMNHDEIQAWISENKLLKTKVTTAFSSTVPENSVISFDLKSVNENNFTRGTNLSIVVSKGEAPAGQVTVENFVGKNFEEMKTWAANKKINLEKTESYSNTVVAGAVVSQSVEGGKAIKEGESITVIVSKGKAVKIPNLVGYTPTMLEAWTANKENNVAVVKKEIYSNEPFGNVIAQSIPANSLVDQGTVLELTVSLYLPVLQTNSREWYGKDYQQLIAWVDNMNYKGANIAAGVWYGYEYSADLPAGAIIEYNCADGNGNLITYTGSEGTNGCGRPLPLNAKIGMKVSKGPDPALGNTPAPEAPFVIEKPSIIGTYADPTGKITVKTSPGASLEIKDTDGKNIPTVKIGDGGKANNLGYADIEFSSPVSTSKYVIIIANLNGSSDKYEGVIPKQP